MFLMDTLHKKLSMSTSNVQATRGNQTEVMDFNILHWNARSSNGRKMKDLINVTKPNTFGAIVITETWGHLPFLDGYKVYGFNGSEPTLERGGGVGIYVHESLSSRIHVVEQNLVSVSCKSGDYVIKVTGTYISTKFNLSRKRELLSRAVEASQDNHYILCGDFNLPGLCFPGLYCYNPEYEVIVGSRRLRYNMDYLVASKNICPSRCKVYGQ